MSKALRDLAEQIRTQIQRDGGKLIVQPWYGVEVPVTGVAIDAPRVKP